MIMRAFPAGGLKAGRDDKKTYFTTRVRHTIHKTYNIHYAVYTIDYISPYMIQQLTFTLKPVTERLRLNKDKHNTLTNAITATLSEFRDVVINFAAIINRSSHLQ